MVILRPDVVGGYLIIGSCKLFKLGNIPTILMIIGETFRSVRNTLKFDYTLSKSDNSYR